MGDHPPADVGVGARFLRRIDVHAAEQRRLAGVEHRVVEREMVADLALVPGQVVLVLLHRSSSPAASPTALPKIAHSRSRDPMTAG